MNNYSYLNTQSKIKKYTRNVLDKMEINDNIKQNYPEYYTYFIEFLFLRHPNYPIKFKNMTNIGLRYNQLFKTQKYLGIMKSKNIELRGVLF